MEIAELLAFSIKTNASDLHLSAGSPPLFRVHGDLRRANHPMLTHAQIDAMLTRVMSIEQKSTYLRQKTCDFACELPRIGRFRVNVFMQRLGTAAVFRTIPATIPPLHALAAPKVLSDLLKRPRGLILVTGPSNSGKSTTLAAMLDALNQSQYAHILTLEDPIEYLHRSQKCLINQREIGIHTGNFACALRSALRQDPNIILIGEMRDLPTVRLALTAAETGHLVLSTLHTHSAAKTIDRLIDFFPTAEKSLACAMIAESLHAIIAQTLLKTKDGNGRVAAYEILINTPAIRNLIREHKVAQIYSAIQMGRQAGMQTLAQSLESLVQHNRIDHAVAQPYRHPDGIYPH